MKCVTCALTILAMLAAAPCPAASLNDYLGNGFEIAHVTSIPGMFSGCKHNEELTFADESTFRCLRTIRPTNGLNTSVYMLQSHGADISVLLIGGRAVDGTITSFRGAPRRLSVDSAPPETSQATTQSAGIGPIDAIAPIQSISKLQDEQTTRLNDAQSQPLLQHPQTNETKEEQDRTNPSTLSPGADGQ